MKKASFFFKNRLYFSCIVFCSIGIYFIGKHFAMHRTDKEHLINLTAPVKVVSVTTPASRMSDYISFQGYNGNFHIREQYAGAYYKTRMLNTLEKGDTVEFSITEEDKERLNTEGGIITLYGLKKANEIYLDENTVLQIDQKLSTEAKVGLGAIAMAVVLFAFGWFVLKLRP